MIYKNKINQLTSEYNDTLYGYNKISKLRFLIFILGSASFFCIFYFNKPSVFSGLFLFFIILFIFLIVKHEKINQEKITLELLLKINQDSFKRKNGDWVDFEDIGEEFIDNEHPYSSDIDVFGKASLFQWINAATTIPGRNKLAEMLTVPVKKISHIIQVQSAVKELSSKIEWRQNFQAEGLRLEKEKWTIDSIRNIIEDNNFFINSKKQKIIFRIFPLIFLISIILVYAFSFLKFLPVLIFILQVIITLIYQLKIRETFSQVSKYRDIIKVYSKLLLCIEKEKFASDYLNKLKVDFENKNNKNASFQILKLEKLLDRINMRHSSIYPVINFLTLWDIQCLISFEQWKRESGVKLELWIKNIGEFEALSSLAIISFDNPGWMTASFSDDDNDYLISAKEMGHPLIDKNSRIYNDFYSNQKGSIAVITGSNMSGKSTFLRTIAINLVLSYAGAPVCAKEFKCSIFSLYTSMRIIDNLDKHLSSFYTELLRIKKILDAASSKEKILFILDEIFRGTNSRDRIMGAKEVLKRLSHEKTTGFVSTHDMELADLENNPALKIKNYHFKEHYKDNKIYFDYKLKNNVSTTSDAIYLMKMVGIEVDTGDN